MPGDSFLELATAKDRQLLDVLFGDAKEAVTIQDRSGQLVYANDRAAEMVGLETGAEMMATPVSDLIGRFQMIDETGKPFPVDSLPGRQVLAGAEPAEITVGYRMAGTGEIRWSRLNASPVKDEDGEIVWAINFFLDITDKVRQRDNELKLDAVSSALAEMSSEAALDAAAKVMVPDVASWCGFHLLDEFDRLIPAGTAFPESPEAKTLFDLSGADEITLDSNRIEARVVTTRKKEVIQDITEEMLDEAEEEFGSELVSLVRALDLGSIVSTPLEVGGSLLGAMTLVRTRREGPFDEIDLALIDAVAERASIALANARLYEREHELADALRQGLTPDHMPQVAGLEIAARYKPLARVGHVGGDFYDVIAIDNE